MVGAILLRSDTLMPREPALNLLKGLSILPVIGLLFQQIGQSAIDQASRSAGTEEDVKLIQHTREFHRVRIAGEVLGVIALVTLVAAGIFPPLAAVGAVGLVALLAYHAYQHRVYSHTGES